jgi:hypothetical protein
MDELDRNCQALLKHNAIHVKQYDCKDLREIMDYYHGKQKVKNANSDLQYEKIFRAYKEQLVDPCVHHFAPKNRVRRDGADALPHASPPPLMSSRSWNAMRDLYYLVYHTTRCESCNDAPRYLVYFLEGNGDICRDQVQAASRREAPNPGCVVGMLMVSRFAPKKQYKDNESETYLFKKHGFLASENVAEIEFIASLGHAPGYGIRITEDGRSVRFAEFGFLWALALLLKYNRLNADKPFTHVLVLTFDSHKRIQSLCTLMGFTAIEKQDFWFRKEVTRKNGSVRTSEWVPGLVAYYMPLLGEEGGLFDGALNRVLFP